MSIFSKKSKALDPLARYESGAEELSASQFRFAGWFSAHRPQFRRAFVWLLIAWSVCSIGYGLYGFGRYIFVGMREDARMFARQPSEFVNYRALQPGYAAKPLAIDGVRVFSNEKDRYDVTAFVNNPNERWAAHVRYRFVFGGQQGEVGSQLVLPGATSLLALFGHKSDSYPGDAYLDILGVDWRHISAHDIPDMQGYIAERLSVSVADLRFVRRAAEGALTDRLTWTMTNDAAYGFWRASFFVVLKSGGDVVGIRSIVLDRFSAGESREIDLRFIDSIGVISDIQLLPSINIFDSSNYLSPDL